MFGWLKVFFMSNQKIDKTPLSYPEINIDKVVKELGLERLAKENGKNELPATESINLDSNEKKIETFFYAKMAESQATSNRRLVDYNTTISDTDLNNQKARIENITEYTSLQIKSTIARAKINLTSLKEDKKKYHEELSRFKKNNKLDMESNYSNNRIFNYSIVIFLLVVETVINTYFFAKGNDFGYVGGAFQAFIFSFMNIAVGFVFAGWICTRYINHVSITKKILAWLGLLVYAVYLLSINLFIAHYRQALSVDIDTATSTAFTELFASPFMFTEIDSFLLVSVGIIASLISVYEGHSIDDPYPKYGATHRNYLDVEKAYVLECEFVTSESTILRKEFISTVEKTNDEVDEEYQFLYQLGQVKQALISNYDARVSILTGACDAVIRKYRDLNMINRETKAPTYFMKNWVPTKEFKLVGDKSDDIKISEQKDLYDGFPAFTQHKLNDVEKLYSDLFDQIHQVMPTINNPEI